MMDRTQKLDAVEKLVSYSGLEQSRAKEFLEKSNWNVDAAYRLFKTNQMEQSGFRKNASTNRYSEPVGGIRPANRHGGVLVRPATDFASHGFGTVTGPAVGGTVHPAFLPPQQLPKFPVESTRERIIPIQIETKPSTNRLERQGAVKGYESMPPPTSMKPLLPSHNENVNNPRVGVGYLPEALRGDKFPKSQSYPVPTKGDNFPSHQVKDDKTTVIRVGHIKGDNLPQKPTMTSYPQANQNVHQQQQQQSQPPPKSTPQTNSDASSSTPKVLKRGISKISQNAMLVDAERLSVLHDIAEDCHDNMYIQTFILPDVTGYAEDFRAFLEKDLIETSTLVSLEQAGRLNWWAELGVCQRLLPMATSGDGNCLLHAASLAMWGIHDRQLMLRKALFDTLTKKYYRQALYRRWRWQQTQANKQAGLIFSEKEWQSEWDNVLRLSSTTPRQLPGTTMQRNNSCCDSIVTQSNTSSSDPDPDSPVVYESLEEFHVFVLAHVIQRPIIVVADTILKDSSGDALAPIPFGGIYLPLEVDASHCYRSPLLLTYDAAHFSALVPMEKNAEEDKNSLPVAIPTVSPDLMSLPIHFSIDPGIDFNWEKNSATFSMSEESKLNLLKRYMDVEKLPIYSGYFDSNGDDKNSTGSYDSDDGLIDKSKKKDNKVSQQLQTVSKQFGSFGKSVGKKLKNLGKGNKEDKKGMGSRKLSMTQSTKFPITISALGELDQQFVWCCKIVLKKSETHQKMIDNYLYDAGERFKKDVTSRRLRNDEIVSRAKSSAFSGVTQQRRVPCVTSGCNLFGTVETSYLCTNCYADQKRCLIDQEKDLYKNFEDKHKKHKDEMNGTKIGKSKFYDMNDSKGTTVSNKPVPQAKLVVDLNSRNRQIPRNAVPVQPKGRSRTPSPDYDNVDYRSNKIPGNVALNQSKHTAPLSPKPANKGDTGGIRCRNPDCDFYGSKDMDYLCSGCYKKKQKDLRHV